MTPDEVKKYYGNGYRFAKETGMSNVSFANWIKWGFVPRGSQLELERITKGKLKFTEDKTDMDEQIIKDAKLSLKKSIKFLQTVQRHIVRQREPLLSRAMFTAWCLDRYINIELGRDIEKAIEYDAHKEKTANGN